MSAPGRAALLLSLGALALGATGCGDDEDDAIQPTISVPQTVEPPPSAETNTAPETETETTAPGGGKVLPGESDSPANDIPPPAGSPQEQFERFCEQNPEACG